MEVGNLLRLIENQGPLQSKRIQSLWVVKYKACWNNLTMSTGCMLGLSLS
jgi:hypothetical protein